MTQLGMDLTLVVPLYNEQHRFVARAPAFAEWARARGQTEVIFVDDGSSDGTPELVRRFIASGGAPMRLLERPHRGKGAAVQAGLENATTSYAAFCDVDLATPLADVDRLVSAAREGRVLAVGSRDVPDATLLRHESHGREALGKAFNRMVRVFAVPGVADTQCGAKAAATSVWEEVLPHLSEAGFAWDVEMLAVASRLGVELREIGVTWTHDDDSRVHVLRDGAAMLRALPRIRRRSKAAARLATLEPERSGSEPASAPGVFDAANATRLAERDANHWWFRAKARMVSAQLESYGNGGGTLVDLGAGAGGVTAMLRWPGEKVGIEGNADLTAVAQARGLTFSAADITKLPLPAHSAQAICLLDVIEHLDDAGAPLKEARRVLARDGVLVVTVPAHGWLWSAADVALGHKRRYTRASLQEQLVGAGFELLKVTHAFSYLIVPVWLKRKLLHRGRAELGLDQNSRTFAALASILTLVEVRLMRRISLPFGTTVLAVASPRPTRDE